MPSLQRVAIGAARLVHTDDLAALRKLVGDEHVLQDGIEAYTVDWTRSHVGGGAVCLPRTTMEVSAVLGFCNEQGIGVVPQGGNTSLVGGAVGRSQGDLILSMRRMNRIIDIDVSSRCGLSKTWLRAFSLTCNALHF